MVRKQEKSAGNIVNIDSIALPDYGQVRRYFAPEKMAQLVASVREHGILEPLIVRPLGSGYELVAGERRLRAAKEVGLAEVPVIIRNFSDLEAYEVALLENLQRDDLNPIDEAEGVLYLLCKTLGMTSTEVVSTLNRYAHAHRSGKALAVDDAARLAQIDQLFLKIGRVNRESFRTNRLPLLNLPKDILEELRKGGLEYTKAKAIAKLKDEVQRSALLEEAIAKDLSLTQIRTRVQEIQGESDPSVLEALEVRDTLAKLAKLDPKNWQDSKRRQEVQRLLAELKALL